MAPGVTRPSEGHAAARGRAAQSSPDDVDRSGLPPTRRPHGRSAVPSRWPGLSRQPIAAVRCLPAFPLRIGAPRVCWHGIGSLVSHCVANTPREAPMPRQRQWPLHTVTAADPDSAMGRDHQPVVSDGSVPRGSRRSVLLLSLGSTLLVAVLVGGRHRRRPRSSVVRLGGTRGDRRRDGHRLVLDALRRVGTLVVRSGWVTRPRLTRPDRRTGLASQTGPGPGHPRISGASTAGNRPPR